MVGRSDTAANIEVRSRAHGGLVVYASWNGATAVARWRVLAGPSARQLAPVASAARIGFETAIVTPRAGRYLTVQAIDDTGDLIGRSHLIKG